MKIGIIIGSVRETRIGEGVARWVLDQARGRDVTYELLDLREFDLPVHTSPRVPATANRDYGDERVNRWGQAIDECDGFIIVTPEYNHGVPGALKNAFDSIFPEWWSKAVAFVSYGAAYGFRVIEQWRPIVANANMFDIKAQVSFSTILDFTDGVLTPAERHATEVAGLLHSLEAATTAMKSMREAAAS